jgi:hypothetical protein
MSILVLNVAIHNLVPSHRHMFISLDFVGGTPHIYCGISKQNTQTVKEAHTNCGTHSSPGAHDNCRGLSRKTKRRKIVIWMWFWN